MSDFIQFKQVSKWFESTAGRFEALRARVVTLHPPDTRPGTRRIWRGPASQIAAADTTQQAIATMKASR